MLRNYLQYFEIMGYCYMSEHDLPISHRIEILNSGKLLREKTFTNFRILQPSVTIRKVA